MYSQHTSFDDDNHDVYISHNNNNNNICVKFSTNISIHVETVFK